MIAGNVRHIILAGILVLGAAGGPHAQVPPQEKLTGLINDFTLPANGSWEVRGDWSLSLRGDSGKADFSANLTMEHSDLWVLTGGNASARNPHTHHVVVTDGLVTPTATGFRVDGDAIVTGNGANPPPFGEPSTVVIEISGSNFVPLSNIKLTFGGHAATHFGSQGFSGVVAAPKQL